MLFAVFAFVVLLGTVFPLIVEALQDRRISVGPPFFQSMVVPIGLALLTLMAIAPVLPWRKASGELLRHRLYWPAWCGTGAIVVALLLGASGVKPLVAFGLGGFAAGSALRQLVLATRRQGLRGLLGRANGGMIVHLGVIMIAVGAGGVGLVLQDGAVPAARPARRPASRATRSPTRAATASTAARAGHGERRRRDRRRLGVRARPSSSTRRPGRRWARRR